MKRRHHSPEQIIRKLAEADKLLAQGQSIEEVCRHLEIAITAGETSTAGEGERREALKELEVENARLKKLLAEAELDKAMLKELAEGDF